MKVTIIRYEKLINLGNYENHKIGVEVQLEEGDTPHAALKRAQAFVEKCLDPKPDPCHIKAAERIVAEPEEHAPKLVKEAQAFLEQALQEESAPF